MHRMSFLVFFFFSSRRRHTRCSRDWSSDVCSSDLVEPEGALEQGRGFREGGVEIGDETEGLVHLLEQWPGRLGGVGDGVLCERCHEMSSGRRWLPGLVTGKTIYYR